MAKYLLDERRGGVCFLTLNRPEIHNAFDEEMIAEVTGFFKEASKEKDLRAIVVKGAGKHFCAGADIHWMKRAGSLTKAKNVQDATRLINMYRAVQEAPMPVIARVHGACYGGGLGIVAASDVVVCSDDIQMSFSECRLGILPAVISSFAIPKIGLSNARRFLLTAETFGAAAAHEMGLAHEICPTAELDARIDKFVAAILKTGPQAVREAKALIAKSILLTPERRYQLTAETLARVRATPEAQEGLAAFLEKRAPKWTTQSSF